MISATKGGVQTIFDYGCGPEPALVDILTERGYDARGWDPFFSANTVCFSDGADLVTCLEVAEHFYSPRTDFAAIASCMRRGGYLAVGTRLVPDDADWSGFESWWYRQDPTHVSFYSLEAIRIVADEAGLELLTQEPSQGRGFEPFVLFRRRGV